MAEAGFYYIGTEASPDAVRCVVCLTELEGWEEDDEPLKEHKNHSSSSACPYLKIKDPYQITVGDVLKLEKRALQYAIVCYVTGTSTSISLLTQNRSSPSCRS